MARLSPELASALASLRARRGFNVQVCCEAKSRLLNGYFARHGLAAAVVGVSGGVDSAVALALVCHAAKQPGSPIRRVVGVLAPMFATAGATNQDRTVERGREVIRAVGADEALVDLSQGLVAVQSAAEVGVGHRGSSWATGQLVSYLRTPAFYQVATLLTDQGLPAVVIGTTNRDEGAYIGFFGKASDGMVDVQLISDLHKSEVYAIAEHLGVPESVRVATPTGDTFDGRTDEQMIGVSYDAIELHALLATSPSTSVVSAELAHITQIVSERHARNHHKYIGSSPAVHFDVYERGVPGGWPLPVRNTFKSPRPTFDLAAVALPYRPVTCEPIADFGASAFMVRGLLSPEESERLVQAFAAADKSEVGTDGYPGTGGSLRAYAHDPAVASALWERLAPSLPAVRLTDERTPTDTDGHPVWRATGVSPYLRFMAYRDGARLTRHYDSAFDFGDGRRTLQSVVIYLQVPRAGGATRLLIEPQRHRPTHERDFADGVANARDHEVLVAPEPRVGDALVMDHRVPHDVAAWLGGDERIVIRTDVIYERCGIAECTPKKTDYHAVTLADDAAAWRINRDPFYREAFAELGSVPAIEDAGYFDDGRPMGEPHDGRADANWLTTPLHKLQTRLAHAEGRLCVLVSTGAFYPVHRGHLAMMELAKSEMEQRGWSVLAGYLSPSHDNYVRLKCGEGIPGAEHRIRLCEQATHASDWLMVDGWEALHTGRSLNFTDVIMRLEAYLSAHVRCARPIDVVYVFGADNARFVGSFVTRGRAVCVPRPGYEDRLAKAMTPRALANPRIVIAGTSAPLAASSTVRAGDEAQLTDDVRAMWSEWKAEPRSESQSGRFYLRDEGDWAVAPWLAGAPNAGEVMHRFRGQLVDALRQAFGEARRPDVRTDIRVELLHLSQQRDHARELTRGARVLSLDPCIEGDANVGVSRCFELALQRKRRGMVARPGWPPLQTQLARIPPGSYVLLDDDRATGETLSEVQRMLPASCRIERVVTLCDVGDDVVDLVDSRDFLAGARDGGLVVALPDDSLARLPYVLPYVRPADRCSVPPSSELALSRLIWQLNRELFARLSGVIRVADVAPAFARFCAYVGFTPETAMTEVCDWHVARLAG